MDTSDPEIEFDEQGVCNHCHMYEMRVTRDLHYDEAGKARLERLVRDIKKKGQGKEYDCIIGVSGGVDSTFVAYQVKKELGLRPLAVHLDNGWDSELAVSNIEKVLKRLKIDLYTYVIDWEEFRDVQLSFLKASVANAEIPTDHAILAILYREAASRNIQFILSGGNLVTEAIMPESWMYEAKDLKHLKAIHKQFGKIPLKTFPQLSWLRFSYYVFLRRIRYIPILNYIPYNKKEAMRILQEDLGWVYYGGKHYESIYTRFFQGYILPEKFHIDKRRAHLSTLVCAGQMEREEALGLLEEPMYDPQLEKEDKEYVSKKLGLTEREFTEIMKLPPKSSLDYPNSASLLERFSFVVRWARKIITYND